MSSTNSNLIVEIRLSPNQKVASSVSITSRSLSTRVITEFSSFIPHMTHVIEGILNLLIYNPLLSTPMNGYQGVSQALLAKMP